MVVFFDGILILQLHWSVKAVEIFYATLDQFVEE